ncbi:hypothetical protein H5410_041582 [Solanum commersonii]|uniref:Uncharacterized protein n=1 Tax=Solanum commersonii TaxID=4109 RepID=A0A9J5XUZ6_SOLCO|nr:hypothetical protein H5410_041582 [Solanum commersonii]
MAGMRFPFRESPGDLATLPHPSQEGPYVVVHFTTREGGHGVPLEFWKLGAFGVSTTQGTTGTTVGRGALDEGGRG